MTGRKIKVDCSTSFTDEEHAEVISIEAEAAALELALCDNTKEAETATVERYLNGWLHRGNKQRPDKPSELALTGGFATALVLANALRTTAVILRRVSPDHLVELLGVFADVPKTKEDAIHKIWRELIKREQLSRVPKDLS